MSLSNRLHNIDYRLAIYLLPIPTLVLYSLCLTSCVSNSPGIPNIYAVKVEGRNTTSAIFSELRVGYFGMCASVSDKLFCQPSSSKTADHLLRSFAGSTTNNTTNTGDSEALISFALTIQSKIILYLLSAAGVLYVLGVIAFLLLKRQLKAVVKDNAIAAKRKKMLRQASIMLAWGSVGLAFASALSISQTTGAMAFVTQIKNVSAIRITAGTTLSALQWLIFVFSALFAGGVSSLFRKQGGFTDLAGAGAGPRMAPAPAPGGGGALPPPPPPPPM